MTVLWKLLPDIYVIVYGSHFTAFFTTRAACRHLIDLFAVDINLLYKSFNIKLYSTLLLRCLNNGHSITKCVLFTKVL